MIDLRYDASTVIEATILVVAALFPVVNPLAAAAVLLNVFSGLEPALHRALARKIAIYCFFLLIGSLLWGVKVLTFFGISIYAVQIGGGLVVAVTGWSLLSRDSNGSRSNDAQDASILDHAFYPYTMPLTVGPGSISVAITLGAHLPAELRAASFLSPRVLIASFVGIALVCIIIYICYRYANAAERLLGASGTSVVMRLSSFILLCIGVQIICTGIKDYLMAIHQI
ncbi:MAG TPA: MarC family protein [Alloacidobacterium sp.]|nr:MarC family protein [Alloacidobacterium sp.]